MARELFDTVTNAISQSHDSIFAHITNWSAIHKFHLHQDLLFIVLEDSPYYGKHATDEYDYWGGPQEPTLFQDVKRLALDKPQRQIVVMLQGNHYHDGYFNLPNITVGKWFTIPEDDLYIRLGPVTDKNSRPDKIGIALNRQMRSHRLALCSLLYGLRLDSVCHITAGHLYKQLNKLPSQKFLDHNPWQYEQHNDHIKHLMNLGFDRMIADPDNLMFGNGKDIYPLAPESDTVINFDNITNFERNLRPLYHDSYVEFVSNRLFCEPTINIDEKYIHTIYAKNFPILISSAGTVAHYRQFGFDMFDDVIDHSYDFIDNPIDRLFAAVSRNQHLLEHPQSTIDLWHRLQHRFNANLDFVKNHFYHRLRRLTLDECNRCLDGRLNCKL